MNIDFKNLDKMIAEKYISVQKHPTLPLRIFNYSQSAQFDRVWNEETLSCRGLILDDKNEVMARPLKKFFNLSEHTDNGLLLPDEEFEVFDKWDGSLGILYWDGEFPKIATRGSFTSDQAIEGTKILLDCVEKFGTGIFDPAYTYLFEIIYPENRIVVDYKGMRTLVLLTAIRISSGEEIPYKQLRYDFEDILPVAKRYDGVKDVTKIKETFGDSTKEGFVIRYAGGLRLKVKMDEYVRLHRLITGVTSKTIWELLKEDQDIDEYISMVPEEFYDWVNQTRKNLEEKRFELQKWATEKSFAIVTELNFIFGDGATPIKIKDNPSMRKEFALRAIKTEHPQLLFALLDNREYNDILWNMVKPVTEKPFTKDIDS